MFFHCAISIADGIVERATVGYYQLRSLQGAHAIGRAEALATVNGKHVVEVKHIEMQHVGVHVHMTVAINAHHVVSARQREGIPVVHIGPQVIVQLVEHALLYPIGKLAPSSSALVSGHHGIGHVEWNAEVHALERVVDCCRRCGILGDDIGEGTTVLKSIIADAIHLTAYDK